MEFFNPNSNIDFMGARRFTAVCSGLIFLVSIAALVINGLNWGLDFTGGTQIEISYEQPANLDDIRHKLSDIGYKEAQVVRYGTSKDVLISIAPHDKQDVTTVVEGVMHSLPGAQKKTG